MRDTLRKAKPQRFDDLIALNALYRPGPLRGGVVDDYIARKHGRVEIKYQVPQLEPILRETYGVIAYQEQVMRIASDLAGFTLGEADLLRKAMGKKDADVMQAQRERFMDGAKTRGIAEKKAAKIFDLMEYLRRLRLQQVALDDLRAARVPDGVPEGELPVALHGGAADDRVAEHRQAGVLSGRVPRPRRAGAAARRQRAAICAFTVTPDGVRFGLGAVKNVGEGAIAVDSRRARERKGRIDSLVALCEDVDLRLVNKRVLESLVKAGAFDSLGGDRRVHRRSPGAAGAPARRRRSRASSRAAACQRDREQGQSQLFGGDRRRAGARRCHCRCRGVAAGPRRSSSRARRRRSACISAGIRSSGSPRSCAAFGARTIAASSTQSEADVSVGGIVSGCRLLKTRKGDRMAAFMLEDIGGQRRGRRVSRAVRASAVR